MRAELFALVPLDLDTIDGRRGRHRPPRAAELGTEREALARSLQKTARRARTVKADERPEIYVELLASASSQATDSGNRT